MSFNLLIIVSRPPILTMNMLLFGLILSLNQGLNIIGLDAIGLNTILLKYYPTLFSYANLNIKHRSAQCAVALLELDIVLAKLSYKANLKSYLKEIPNYV